MQNTSVILNAGDILHLGTVGVNEIGVSNENLQVFPNPMQGQAEISFYAKQAGNACLSIYDIACKEVLKTESKFLQGIQKYKLAGLKQGMYFINISGDGYFYTAKLISQNVTASEAKIKYIASEKPEVVLNTQKSTKSTVNMAYTTGDRLLFKGSSGNYSNIITDIPTTSKTITFNFTACTDFDNNNYATVQIGTQTWMAENLKTTHYKNGTAIPNVTDSLSWISLTTGAYCDYNNTPANSTTYGRLYNWFTVNTSNLCPTGWHVPNDAEWHMLTNYLGGDCIAGGKLKEASLAHWLSPNEAATNETGFAALPGGNRSNNGTYLYIGDLGSWWSSFGVNWANKAWYESMGRNNSCALLDWDYEPFGFSVRCLKD